MIRRLRLSRLTWWIVGIAFFLGSAILLSLSLPVQTWRTGRAPAEPLTLALGGPELAKIDRLWINTDAACGTAPRADPDDCFALILLFKSRGAQIVGISTVFGNAALAVTDNTTSILLEQLRHEQKNVVQIYTGAAVPVDDATIAAATPAREALREALQKGPLTIVSLGPLTNIAAALDQRPQLQANVTALITVMGRRPGHIFHPAEGADGASWLGHGPIFRDFNFAKDKQAAMRIIAMRLPLILVPYDATLTLAINDADLADLFRADGVVKWLAEASAGWLATWKTDTGQPGFYPFDLAAAAYVLHPASFWCAAVEARVARDDDLWTSWFNRPQALLVSATNDSQIEKSTASLVRYCPLARSEFKQTLLTALMGRDRPATLPPTQRQLSMQ